MFPCVSIYAVNVDEALTILGARADVSVLLSDVDLPGGAHGYDLARQVHEHWPRVELLLTSGRQWPTAGDVPPGAAFLAKPCPNDVLVSYVQAAAARVIASRQGAPASPDATSDDPVPPSVRCDQEAYPAMLAMITGPDDRPGWVGRCEGP
jgi:DNA-binding NtrC family response regulator